MRPSQTASFAFPLSSAPDHTHNCSCSRNAALRLSPEDGYANYMGCLQNQIFVLFQTAFIGLKQSENKISKAKRTHLLQPD